MNSVWGYDFGPNTNIVEVYIAYLRKKVDLNQSHRLIRNLRGFGYTLSDASLGRPTERLTRECRAPPSRECMS